MLVERTSQQPRGYTAPKSSMAIRVMRLAGPVVIGGMFVAGWVFGLYVLFRTRNWDAFTRPLPLAICTLVLVQVALTTINPAPCKARSPSLMSILLVGTVLPALSGVTLWIGRRSPARLWAAEQLIRGKLLVRAVSASLVDGVSCGVIIAAVGVLVDWAALTLPGFVPSISREIDAVEAGMGSRSATPRRIEFIALGIALAVETLDRARLIRQSPRHRRRRRRARGRIEPAGDSAGADAHRRHERRRRTRGVALSVPRFPRRLDRGHRRRARHDAMAARSLEDPTLLQLSNGVLTLVFVLAIAGGWDSSNRACEPRNRPNEAIRTQAPCKLLMPHVGCCRMRLDETTDVSEGCLHGGRRHCAAGRFELAAQVPAQSGVLPH